MPSLPSGTAELIYRSLAPVTIAVVDADGNPFTLPDPNTEPMTLIFETDNLVDIFVDTTESGGVTILDDEITFTPTEALVANSIPVDWSLRGEDNRRVAYGYGFVRYAPNEDE